MKKTLYYCDNEDCQEQIGPNSPDSIDGKIYCGACEQWNQLSDSEKITQLKKVILSMQDIVVVTNVRYDEGKIIVTQGKLDHLECTEKVVIDSRPC